LQRPQRLVLMPMAVFAYGHRLVIMAMGLGQVQHHTGQHQRAAQGHHPAGRPVTQCDRENGPDERGEGEDRACAGSAEGTLRSSSVLRLRHAMWRISTSPVLSSWIRGSDPAR